MVPRGRRPTGPAVRVRPTPGDKVPVPAKEGRWLHEDAPETLAGEQSCESGQDGPVGRLERRSIDLASEDGHLVAEYDDLDGEVSVPATGESDELEEQQNAR